MSLWAGWILWCVVSTLAFMDMSWHWMIHVSKHCIVFLGLHLFIYSCGVFCRWLNNLVRVALQCKLLAYEVFLVNISCAKSEVLPNSRWGSASRSKLFTFCLTRHLNFVIYAGTWWGTDLRGAWFTFALYSIDRTSICSTGQSCLWLSFKFG